MTAAPRLFDNENTTFERILAIHTETTRLRIAVQPVAILTQDTTETDLTRVSPSARVASRRHSRARSALSPNGVVPTRIH